MLADIQEAFGAASLTLNVSKCKAQLSSHTARTPQYMDVNGMRYSIVHLKEGFRVLGAQFTLVGGVSTELDWRIAALGGSFTRSGRC